MSAGIQPAALASCIRSTLDLFLADHPYLEASEVQVHETNSGLIRLTVNEVEYELVVRATRSEAE